MEISASRLEQLTKILQQDEERKKREMLDFKGLTRLQELEDLTKQLQNALDQEREKNRALIFKAGQIFLSNVEKDAVPPEVIQPVRPPREGPDFGYSLADDEALMRLMQRLR